MIEMLIDTIRVSLISQQRIIMLREVDGEQQLAIWIGPCEAEAIESRLRETELARPMTHDLLKILVEELGATLKKIEINDLDSAAAVFRALLYLEVKGEVREIDCRPSDAMALAVRWDVPIYVAESVMEEAGIVPEPDILGEDDEFDIGEEGELPPDEDDIEASAGLDAFKDFLDNLDD